MLGWEFFCFAKSHLKHSSGHIGKVHCCGICRSVLLYNKHGLLLDAFMKEYREACGRPLPFK